MNPTLLNDPEVSSAVASLRQAFQDFDETIARLTSPVIVSEQSGGERTMTQFKPSADGEPLQLARVLRLMKPVGRIPVEHQDVFADVENYDPRASYK